MFLPLVESVGLGFVPPGDPLDPGVGDGWDGLEPGAPGAPWVWSGVEEIEPGVCEPGRVLPEGTWEEPDLPEAGLVVVWPGAEDVPGESKAIKICH